MLDFKPMLAEDVEHYDGKPPWGSAGWMAELKYDGIRLIWTNEGGSPRYYARSGNEHTGRYPFLADLALPPNTMLDGELVVPKGMSSDACALVNRGELVYAVFDVLKMDGHDLSRQPFDLRRQVVEEIGGLLGPRAMPSLTFEPKEEIARQLMAEGQEGVILKRKMAPYQEGRRSWDWLKVKASFEVDAVIVDCDSPPTRGSLGDNNGWVVLSYGYQVNGQFVRAGSVGSSEPREIQQAKVGRVAVIKCNGINPETGALRHPRILRFRSDKPAGECALPTMSGAKTK